MAYSVEDIKKMNYVQFISLLQETNRCPGGKNTIRKILQNTFANSHSKILEIGSNTGFTSLEVARTIGAEVTGIDPVLEAVTFSQKLLLSDAEWIQKKVRFLNASAYDLPFSDNYFDIIFAGGATSFMADKVQALNEYYRVLKPWGFLSVANLYYHTKPPLKIIDQVSNTIGVSINPWNIEDWKDIFTQNQLFETYYTESHILEPVNDISIESYVDIFLKKPHIKNLPKDVVAAIKNRWTKTISIFNENHKYLGFFITIFRKRHLPEEPELFLHKKDSHNVLL